jgi:hypothetical protein
MRVVGEIPHPNLKITIFSWNNRYLIKLEDAVIEQTFKVSAFDITTENDIYKILDTEFLDQAVNRFGEMSKALAESMQRNDVF